jgi:hypothetical protein
MSLALRELKRVWWSIELPAYRNHPRGQTYSPFEYETLPRIERKLDDHLEWLLAEPPVRASLADDEEPERAATLEQLHELWPDGADQAPSSFRAFLASPEPRRRLRSATACYLDLGSFIVPVEAGGSLVHFLSDQQWVMHWLLYVGPGRQEAVVVTYRPYGFDAPDEAPPTFEPRRHSAVCAESFAEFLYRFWIENEIWFALDAKGSLTDEQRKYVEHYQTN